MVGQNDAPFEPNVVDTLSYCISAMNPIFNMRDLYVEI